MPAEKFGVRLFLVVLGALGFRASGDFLGLGFRVAWMMMLKGGKASLGFSYTVLIHDDVGIGVGDENSCGVVQSYSTGYLSGLEQT